jgi:hypothetical protein
MRRRWSMRKRRGRAVKDCCQRENSESLMRIVPEGVGKLVKKKTGRDDGVCPLHDPPPQSKRAGKVVLAMFTKPFYDD